MIESKTVSRTCDKHFLEYEATEVNIGDKKMLSPCPRCSDDLKHKVRDEDVEENEKIKRQKVAGLFRSSGIPPRYTTRTFTNYHADTEQQKRVLSVAANFSKLIAGKKTGAGLIMSGNVGTGKTHLACAIGNEFMRSGGSVLFITVAAIIRRIRETYNRNSTKTEQEAIDEFREIDLLIIDEVGIQKGTESEEYLLFEIINDRYSYYKSTVLMSNLNAAEIQQHMGSRVMDRLREDGGKFVALDWESYRGRVKDSDLPMPDDAKY